MTAAAVLLSSVAAPAAALAAPAPATGKAQARPATSAAVVPGTEDRAARLQAELDRLVGQGYPGAIAYVRRDGQRWQLASGTADLATGRAAQPTDRFRIASNTKSFTATVLLQLAGEGWLSLDDPVHRWLPEVIPGTDGDLRRITVRELLNHTSGVYDPASEPEFFAPYLDHGDRDFVYHPADVVRTALAHPLTSPPGTRHEYSNTNYLLAGMVIEAVTGRGAATEIEHRIITPLGLRHTSFPLTDPEIEGPHLHGYDLARTDLTRFSPSYDWTAGAMVSTVDDLARFHRMLLSGKLLRPAQQRELLHTVPIDGDDNESGDSENGDNRAAGANEAPGYGLGVLRRQLPCDAGPVTVWGHDGGGPGYTSLSLSTADNRRQIVLAANTFDLRRDLAGEQPVPAADPGPLLTAALCD